MKLHYLEGESAGLFLAVSSPSELELGGECLRAAQPPRGKKATHLTVSPSPSPGVCHRWLHWARASSAIKSPAWPPVRGLSVRADPMRS